jgi:ferric-dicitrate binding protein FerR (iron transport regulator)
VSGQWRYALLSARLLRGARARIRPQRSSAPDHTIAMLGGVITVAAERRRRRRAVGIAGVATAMLGVALLLALGPGRTAPSPMLAGRQAPAAMDHAMDQRFVAAGSALASVMAANGEIQPLLVGQEWRVGERLRSDALPIALNGADGTTLEVDPRSELQLVRADVERWFRLARGAVSAHVTKLKAGERFVIATSDAEVEVRGTRFQVTVVPADEACGQGVVTRVAVSEGVVVVRSRGGEARVEAGHHWPLGCPERTVSTVAPVPERPAVSARHAPARASSPSSKSASPESISASTLATENDLFSAALKAGRAGDRREAVELLDVLLARFPNSPLKQSAEAARAKLSESIPPAR